MANLGIHLNFNSFWTGNNKDSTTSVSYLSSSGSPNPYYTFTLSATNFMTEQQILLQQAQSGNSLSWHTVGQTLTSFEVIIEMCATHPEPLKIIALVDPKILFEVLAAGALQLRHLLGFKALCDNLILVTQIDSIKQVR